MQVGSKNMNKTKIIKFINEQIKKEKDCMAQDQYEEQELEHINQIEMAKKIKKFITGESR